ncbi:preprotein translocase subunit SecG [Thermodesulfobacterium hydrogeniphilum]|uniref:preprotein translocase subunit SecG n=1 Tax=Thermodesulfobacterium hydrogeniphilum TaxID=161156 RepID=UPI00068F40A4|nr:preprotein translocase subunit SecG [Thermodesulfobacterium hydrogeniphilum]
MEGFLLIFQIILSILIVLIVLVNVTKGSEYGAVFRGAETIFGGAGPTSFLNKVTMILIVLFFLNSLLLTKLITEKNKSVMFKIPQATTKVKTRSEIPTPPETIPVPPKKEVNPSENTSKK